MPNFVKIGQSLAKVLTFFDFSRWRPSPLGFLKSRNFIGYWGPEDGFASTCQFLSKSVNHLRRYEDFNS